MSTRYVRNGEVRIAYEELGGSGGEPLLLVMGLGASRFWWPEGLVETLVRRGFHVAAYDQRDAGESTHLSDRPAGHPVAELFGGQAAYSAEDMTDDAVAVLDALGWESAHLFGHSMGGLLAQRTGLRHPERVRSLVSSGALPSDARGLGQLRYVRPSFLLRVSRLELPEGPGAEVAAGVEILRLLASPGFAFDEGIARRAVERELERTGRLGFRDREAQARQSGARWSGPRLAELVVPAFVLHGERDQVLRPTAGRDTAAAIPGARLLRVPGLGHDLPRALWPTIGDEVRALADRATQPA